MKTANSGRTLMTPGLTGAPFSEAMPAHPQNGDEVIAVNLGSSVYTLTGSITGGNVALDAGETAILVYAGSTAGWYVTWRSATGTVTYPISVDHGGTGIDGTGVLLFAATGTAAKFSSPDGISLLAQTSVTDGSNANPTAVFAGNTGQTAPLTEWRGTDGTTKLGSFEWAGAFNLFAGAEGLSIWALGTSNEDPDYSRLLIYAAGGGNNGIVFDELGGGVGTIEAFHIGQATGYSIDFDSINGAFGSISFQVNSEYYAFAAGAGFQPPSAGTADLGGPGNKWKDGYFGGTVDAAAYKVGGAAGGSASVTTASLVGKTMTFVNGLFTGIA